jgi:maltose alpha-D-glucosyltransferase / alpha-amylase
MVLDAGVDAVLAMCYSWRGNRVITVHNFSREAQRIALRVEGEEGRILASLFRTEESTRARDGAHHITIDAYGYHWYRVGGLNYSVRSIARPSIED